MIPLRRLFGEFQRRSLLQPLGVYLAGSWVALQIIDIVVDSLDLPRWLPALAILLIVGGLPVVLVTAYLQRGGGGEDPHGSGAGSPESAPAEDPVQDGADHLPVSAWLFTWRNVVVGGIIAFALWGVVAAGWLLLAAPQGPEASARRWAPDEELLAVFPFHFTGRSELAFLGEGIVDLLAAKLTGEGGLRAADPRSVMSAWRRVATAEGGGIPEDTAVSLGQSLGAGRILLGSIVDTPSGLVLNASVLRARTGELEARANVEGPTDSLTVLIDRLAVRLLALETGERDRRLAALTNTSLQALKAYIDGQVAYRQGSYSDANQHYERALAEDSTFALAALGWVSSAWWSAGFEDFHRALTRAWALRGGLSPRDQALLDAWAGPRYPQGSGWAEHLRLWELAISLAPERPEAWYESGDIYFHFGNLLGVPNGLEQAGARFRRALELDSTYAAPLGHLVELAALQGDEDEIRAYARAYLAIDSAGDTSDFTRWRAASALGDRIALEEVHGRFALLGGPSLNRIMGLAQLHPSTVDEAGLAETFLSGRMGTRVERWEWILGLHSLALNRGRPGEAAALAEALWEVEDSPGEGLRVQILDALYWDGDPGAAAQAAARLATRIDAALESDAALREAQLADLCVVEQWRLRQGITSTAGRSVDRIRSAFGTGGAGSLPLRHAVCAASVDALLAIAEGHPRAAEAVDRLDGLLLLIPDVVTGDDPSLAGHFIVAEWREAQRDLEGALSAVRRRHNHWFTGVRYLTTYLREEGRLAALTGDSHGAIRAYRHYLGLRANPDPQLIPAVERVRAQLERLVRAAESGSWESREEPRRSGRLTAPVEGSTASKPAGSPGPG